MDTKQKFVRLKNNDVIIFPCGIEHSKFRYDEPVSAGFCYINTDKQRLDCFGESYSLGIKSDPKNDTLHGTKQIFGVEAMLKLLSPENGR